MVPGWLRRRRLMVARERGPDARPDPVGAREAYERVAAAYPPEAHNPLMELEQAALAELLPPLGGSRLLDAGCGSGRYLRLAMEGGLGGAPSRLVGCDVSPAMLARAAGVVAGQAGLVCTDVAALPFADAAFDVVVCGLALGHVADLRGALAEIGRVLAPGGIAVWSDVHPAGTLAGWRRDLPDGSGRHVAARQHLHLFSDHLAGCRQAGLEIDAAREPRLEFDHPQRGWPAVLALRARKRT